MEGAFFMSSFNNNTPAVVESMEQIIGSLKNKFSISESD
jgi:hypothetical protein